MSSLTSAVRELRGLNDHPGDHSKISIKTHYVEMSCIQFICWIHLNLNICIFFTALPLLFPCCFALDSLICIKYLGLFIILGLLDLI